MGAARPLLRSLQGPAMNLAEAGGEAVRAAVLNRVKNVAPSTAASVAHTTSEAVSAAVMQRLTDPPSTLASLDSTSRLESPPPTDRPLPRGPSPLLESPVAQAVLAGISGRSSAAEPAQASGSAEGRSLAELQHSTIPSPSGSGPGSPNSRPKPLSLTSPGTATGTDGWAQALEMRSGMPGDRQLQQSRELSMVSASANGRKAFFLDTLALVRRLEAEGLTAKQAEAITNVITDVLHESLESAAHTFVSKAEMQKYELMNEAAMSRMKTELQSSSDIRLVGIGKEVEGLRTGLDKLKSELKYEVDKLTAGQRLDLNLEKGRVKEEINVQAQETSAINNKLDREVNALKAQLEAAKFDVIRYCVGTLVSVSAVGLGMLRVLM